VSYDKIKSKITISYIANFSISPSSTCLELIGFSTSDVSLLNSDNNAITSINCINLQAYHCVCIGTNFITNSINISNSRMPTIICSIPINTSPNSMIVYTNPSNYKINIYSSYFSMINIKLLDQNSNIIDTNGCHYSLTLQLDIIKFTE